MCEVFQPITFDRLNDTERTIREIKNHNAVWVELCAKLKAPPVVTMEPVP